MIEAKVALTERSRRPINFFYHYMENSGFKYLHKLPQFVTTLKSRRKCSTDLKLEDDENDNLLSILYSKPL